jgi:hypothetical protein
MQTRLLMLVYLPCLLPWMLRKLCACLTEKLVLRTLRARFRAIH